MLVLEQVNCTKRQERPGKTMDRLEPVELGAWRLPAVDEVSPQTVPGDFSSQLRHKLRHRNMQASEPNLLQSADRDLDEVDLEVQDRGAAHPIPATAVDDTASKKSHKSSSLSRIRRAMSVDGGSATSKGSLASRLSQQLSKLVRPSCLAPSIVGDKTVWDFEPTNLCDLIAALRGGRSFKLVQREGQPSLQLLEPTESILMTTFRQDSAPKLVETPMEIVFKGNAYQASMQVPLSALRVLQDAAALSDTVWISSFCINIADSLQARFKSVLGAKERAEIVNDWEAQGLNTTESLRQVLIGSMFRLYCQHKTFIGPSAYADEQYLTAGWAMQESLYGDIVLKVSENPEILSDEEEVEAVLALRKKGGRLNSTANTIIRRRAVLGTAEEVEVTKRAVVVKGNVTPDRTEKLLGLLRRVYWKVQVASEEGREQAVFQVLRERGLVTPADIARFRDTLPPATAVDLSLGAPRVLRRRVRLSSSASPRGDGESVAGSQASRDARAIHKHRAALRADHVPDANLKRVVAGPDDFEEVTFERAGSDLALGPEALRGYRAEAVVRAPACGCKCEVAQWQDRRRPALFHRRLRVLDSAGLPVMVTHSSFQHPPAATDTGTASGPRGDQLGVGGERGVPTGGCTLYLGAEHRAGDSYLFWVAWGAGDSEGGEGGDTELDMARRPAVVVHIASDIEEDFRGLPLSQASTP